MSLSLVQNAVVPSTGNAALEIAHLSKRFGGALALDDVSLRVAPGEVHGLLGSNGSGKSTLIKVLAGFHSPEAGAVIKLYGEDVPQPISAAQMQELGLAFVHQHLGLIPALSVTENLFLNALASHDDWAINWPQKTRQAEEIFARFGLAIDPNAETGSLSAVQQALLAIVRAFEGLQLSKAAQDGRSGVLILDEPTPFLPRAGVEQLFDLVRNCTASGASVIFVSHDVDEVREITDRATILRDGKLIETVQTADTDHAGFVSRIIGKSLVSYAGAAKMLPAADADIKFAEVSAPGLGPVSFAMAPGEILGVTGLIGSGFDALLRRLYGATDDASGLVNLGAKELDLATLTPVAAMAMEIGYLSADRLGEAAVGSLPIADNLAMPVFDQLKKGVALTAAAILSHGARLSADAGVKPNNPALALAALSGGNAQKVVLAKWLQLKPRLLLLDEPTQGVDVGARQQIWDQLDAAAEQGAAIIVASSDYEQLAQICHRVLIFSRGQIVGSLAGSELQKETIAERCYHAFAEVG